MLFRQSLHKVESRTRDTEGFKLKRKVLKVKTGERTGWHDQMIPECKKDNLTQTHIFVESRRINFWRQSILVLTNYNQVNLGNLKKKNQRLNTKIKLQEKGSVSENIISDFSNKNTVKGTVTLIPQESLFDILMY